MKKTFREFKLITATAIEFLNQYPTWDSLVNAAYKESETPNYLLEEFYSSCFIVQEHPIKLNRIVESIVLEELYNVQDAIAKQKREMFYDELFSSYKQRTIQELYETRNNQLA